MLDKKRPTIEQAKVFNATTPIEAIQNTVLRPIIKQSHLVLLHHLNHYLSIKNPDFHTLTTNKQTIYLTSTLQKDLAFRQELKGIIIGEFTIEELKHYHSNHKEFGKRITQMILQRFIDSLPELHQMK